MSKITSKRQVTIPKDVAERYGLGPGDEILWLPAGPEIRVVPGTPGEPAGLGTAERLALFDKATRRRDERLRSVQTAEASSNERGWTREQLHDRGRPR